MKTHKILIIITSIFAVASLVFAVVLQCKNEYNQYSFCINILIGVFSSSLLLFANSLVGYFIEKRRFFNELKLRTNTLRLFVKKVTTDNSKMKENGSVECTMKIDGNLKSSLFEIIPYSLSVAEHLEQLPQKTINKDIDTEKLVTYCNDINTIAEYLCEMQVNRSIKVDFRRIEEIFDMAKINEILRLHENI